MQRATSQTPHIWHFQRLGDLDQVRIQSVDDLRNLRNLDPKLWVALSCPTRGLEFAPETLDVLDDNKDGRIRLPEICNTVDWVLSVLKQTDGLMQGGQDLPLDAINNLSTEGDAILQSAKYILRSLGKQDSSTISVHEAASSVQRLNQQPLNGDGIIPPSSIEDASLLRFIEDVIATIGGKADRSGETGIDRDAVQDFLNACNSFSTWWAQGETDANTAHPLLPLNNDTPTAFAALVEVRTKIDDFFARCSLAAFDPRSTEILNGSEHDYIKLASKELNRRMPEIAERPLARVGTAAILPLGEGINPAWRERIDTLRQKVILPLLQEDLQSLDIQTWRKLKATFTPYEKWQSSKTGAAVEKLGISRIREILQDNVAEKAIERIHQDFAFAPQMASIDSVEKLCRLYRDLITLLENFVNFIHFYRPDRRAIFQAGTLYLDGRSCQLCIPVEDPARHAILANNSRVYLAYCECTRKATGEKRFIAAAFTNGDSDHLMIGRNGVFFDCKGNDWDATVVKLSEHPISVYQAFWSPYKRASKMISNQIEKMAAARDKELTAEAGTSITTTLQTPATSPDTARKQAFDIAKFAGIFAAIGLAIGAIGTMLSKLLSDFVQLTWWQMPLAVAGIIILISSPSMIMACIQLRQRTLGPILDACGWAINGRIKINLNLGRILTQRATLPKGSQRNFTDPYNSSHGRTWLLLSILLATASLTWWVLS